LKPAIRMAVAIQQPHNLDSAVELALLYEEWWCGVDDVNDRPVGNPKRRCDEHISKFSLSYKTKVINLVGESQT
jgi:hypothetical protein